VIWDPADLDLEPAGPDDTWPLARHFEGIGWVVMRSGWDSTATHAIFDCGDFYYGHQHPAENSFTIFKKGSLAINSGRYEWESDHRPNYMARTIASNTILVYDPDEMFATSGGKVLSNDGGQLWPLRGRESYGPSQGTEWDTGDIIAFETNPHFSYICGEAARAYNPNKLKVFTRQFIHLQPDLFIIFDRVEAIKPEFGKYWIMHAVNEPVIKGHLAEISEREGKLYVQTIFPEDAVMRKVGGPGHEFEIFGKNYPPALSYYSLKQGEEWGSWRIEVTPGSSREYDCFLHLLLAGEKSSASPPEFEPLGSVSTAPGVRVYYQENIYEILFNSTGKPGGRIRIEGRDGAPIMEKPLTEQVQPQAGIGN
jgi:heparin/heparan-sulfate lyase